ncbi:MAG TPA: hypothetical protein VH854_04685 [Thermoanaerobaculia bacterium]|nr:hypothetical protein [Thermoanaerobaculia bacterium]
MEPEPPISAEPPDLVALVRSPESPRELRLFAARGLLPLGSEDRIRALLAVLLDGDPEIAAPARETFASVPPDDVVRFLDDAETSSIELDAVGRHSQDHFVLERVIRHRRVGDETLLALASTVTGAPQDALIVNQVRLLRQPELIQALLDNPGLTADGRRRLNELQEEFFEKEARRREQERKRRDEEKRLAEQEAKGIVFEDAAEAEGAPSADDGLPAGGEEEDEFSKASTAQIYRRIAVMTVKEKVELAQKGTKEERRILIADVNKLVSMAVLNCEAITLAEVESFCVMRHLNTDLFQAISKTREWIRKPKIQLALVSNPAVPINITLPLVKFLGIRELRILSRDRNLPEVIRTAAGKVLFDKRGG